MSLLKPDINYNPKDKIMIYDEKENTAFKADPPPSLPVLSKDDLHNSIRLFLNNFTDADFIRFFNIAKTTTLTCKNIRDSATFLEKFIPLYVGTLKKTFPNKNWSAVEESLFIIQKEVASQIKDGNIENLFILPMLLGMLEAQLNIENY